MKKGLISLAVVSMLYSETFQQFQQQHYNTFNTYKKNLEKEFQEYKKTLDEEFKQYKKELSKYWDEPKLTTKKTFVEYSKDKKVRKIVNYDKEQIKIDVIAKSQQEAEKKAKAALAKLSIETTNEAFNNNPVLTKVEKKFKKVGVSSKPENKPLIADVIYKKPPTIQDVKNYVNSSFKKAKIIKKPAKVSNSYIYSVSFPLPKNSYIIKAKRLKPYVLDKAQKFKLTPALIYAIIETESSYNPMARSYVPAFGLMQIVPQTAGKDAYKMLYGKPKLLTPGYLYNEKNNILIGSAYLKKLYYNYFKNVKNPLSRLYLTIAAYNTGAGNVACAFNSKNKDFKGRTLCYRMRGDYNIKKAVPKINSLTPDQVYNQLINNLRYDEAKNYLKKVNYRLKKYFVAIKKGKL